MPLDYRQLRSLTVRQLITALRRDGFYLWRQRGSHQQYHHPDGRKVKATFHSPGQTFAPKTLRTMLETQAQWTEEDLRRLRLLR